MMVGGAADAVPAPVVSIHALNGDVLRSLL
jgi:hypothetical protein